VNHYYVTEFEPYQDARNYLREWRETYPLEDDGEFPHIVGPGLNTCEAYDESN